MLKKALAVGIMTLMLIASTAEAGLYFVNTRVIFPGNKKEGVLHVHNDSKILYLMQAWVTLPDNEKANPPFFMAPPLSRIEPGERKAVRIFKTKQQLPEDRETFYWVNVKAIPSIEPKANQIVLAVTTTMKMFYRPAAIKGNPAQVAKKLTWKRVGEFIQVENPTPFYYTFFKVVLDGKELKTGMIAPFSTLQLDKTADVVSREIKWQYISDLGVSSEWISASL